VVVVDFNVNGPGVCPDKAYAPLVIDADAMLADPVARQSLQSIAGRRA